MEDNIHSLRGVSMRLRQLDGPGPKFSVLVSNVLFLFLPFHCSSTGKLKERIFYQPGCNFGKSPLDSDCWGLILTSSNCGINSYTEWGLWLLSSISIGGDPVWTGGISVFTWIHRYGFKKWRNLSCTRLRFFWIFLNKLCLLDSRFKL